TVSPGYKKELFITNLRSRDKESHDKSCLLNPSKYFWEYGLSNHCELLYGKYGPDKVHYHDARRLRMRIKAKIDFGIDNTLESLEKYFIAHLKRGDWNQDFNDFVEEEVSMIDFFRYKVLKQDLMTEI